jgi:endonuclease YncB( thermonuclease family)
MIARVASIVVAFVLLASAGARAEAYTKVFVNGTAVPVFFNDGDSFRVQAGPLRGVQARLSGYNTLESFGPAHSWGTWTTKEMYAIAKLATLTARKGVWHCEGDGAKDGYGRLLLFCKDLAAHLIRNGLAHAYSVNSDPADPELLAVQKEAMRERRGMWAHGIPRFVMTSLHSKDEGGDKHGVSSNRLISTYDGHSDKWVHEDTYKECQNVCHEVPDATDAELDKVIVLLKADEEAAGVTGAMDAALLRETARALIEMSLRGAPLVVTELGVYGLALPPGITQEQAGPIVAAMTRISAAKKIVATGKRKDTCQVYVDFKRRFGGERAECLR